MARLSINWLQNNPQILKSIFRVDHKWIWGENGTQSLSFQIMKCVDWWEECHIKKINKLYCQNNPQSLKSTFKWIKVKYGFNFLAFN